jgi:hypothetical protein
MRNNVHLEKIAEDYISFKLQDEGFLVAKPKFDKNGADLIVFITFANGSKFGRIQSKGRSLLQTPHTEISIPFNHVKEPFFLFVYIKYMPSNNLYVFFAEEIKKWNLSNDNYILNISKKNIDDGLLDRFLLNENKISKIKNIIKRTTSEQEREMFNLIKLSQDINKKEREIRKLKSLINEYKIVEKDIEISDRNLEKLYTQVTKIAKELIESTPLDILNLIEKYRNEGFTEESVLKELAHRNCGGLSSQEIWLIILYKYNTIKQYF